MSTRKILIAICVVNLGSLLFVLLNLKNLPPLVPLYYGNPAGSSQLAPSVYLLVPSGFVLAFVCTNAIITKLIDDKFLQSLLTSAALIFTVLETLTVIKIISLVGNI